MAPSPRLLCCLLLGVLILNGKAGFTQPTETSWLIEDARMGASWLQPSLLYGNRFDAASREEALAKREHFKALSRDVTVAEFFGRGISVLLSPERPKADPLLAPGRSTMRQVNSKSRRPSSDEASTLGGTLLALVIRKPASTNVRESPESRRTETRPFSKTAGRPVSCRVQKNASVAGPQTTAMFEWALLEEDEQSPLTERWEQAPKGFDQSIGTFPLPADLVWIRSHSKEEPMSLYCGIDLHSTNRHLVVLGEKDCAVQDKRVPN